jgi:hypothetical protein
MKASPVPRKAGTSDRGTSPAVNVLQSDTWRNGEGSDPRYQDPLIDPRRPSVRDPAKPAEPQRIELEDDAGRGTIWGWIVGIVALIVVAMLAYDYNRPIPTTADNPPSSSSPGTTGAAPALAPKINPPVSTPAPAPATPAPADTPH